MGTAPSALFQEDCMEDQKRQMYQNKEFLCFCNEL